MRVSIDCRYVRERPSGIGNYVQALLDRIPALAPDDSFQLWASPKLDRSLSASPNVTQVEVSAQANNIPTLAWPQRLVDLHGVNVLHAPFNILGRGYSCATVVTIHDLMWLLEPKLCEASWWRRLYQVPFYRAGLLGALQGATRIVAISKATADVIAQHFPLALGRVRVIAHGIEASFRPPADPEAVTARAAELIGCEGPFLLVVGQNAPYKNHLAVVEAFAAASLPANTRLVFVQRLNPGGPISRTARAHGVSDRVVWLPQLADDDAIMLMQSALALVQFSRCEGFGMPALEAMACGTPVIASDIPALSEVLGAAGIKVGLRVEQLASAMARLVAEPSWREDLCGIGLERAGDFSWEKSARLHLELYREAAQH